MMYTYVDTTTGAAGLGTTGANAGAAFGLGNGGNAGLAVGG